MVIAALLELGGALDAPSLLRLLEERLLVIPRFRQRVVEPAMGAGAPAWEEVAVDLHAHVHHRAIGAGGEDALRRLAGELISTPLPRDRPLWEMHLLERAGAAPFVLCRIHHAVADGFALLGVLLSLCDAAPDARTPAVQFDVQPERLHAGASLLRSARRFGAALAEEAGETLRHPKHAVELAGTGLRYGAALARLISLPPDHRTVLRGPLGPEKRVAWTGPIPLAAVRSIGRERGATINDVLMATLTGGLRRYLARRGEDVGSLELRAMIPVNLRPLDRPVSLGNHFGLVLLDLPVCLKDAGARLNEVKRRMDALKHSPEAVVGMAIVGAMGLAPRALESLGVRFFTDKASAVLTNVPGPKEPLAIAGAPIRRILFWVPQSGELGLGLSIFSYAGQVSLGVMSDAARIPDPEQLVADIEAEHAAFG